MCKKEEGTKEVEKDGGLWARRSKRKRRRIRKRKRICSRINRKLKYIIQ